MITKRNNGSRKKENDDNGHGDGVCSEDDDEEDDGDDGEEDADDQMMVMIMMLMIMMLMLMMTILIKSHNYCIELMTTCIRLSWLIVKPLMCVSVGLLLTFYIDFFGNNMLINIHEESIHQSCRQK